MEQSDSIPGDLHYSKEHEWVRLEEGSATVGITDHAQGQLGEITYVELPAVGTEVSRSDELGSIDSAKAASDIYAPLGGVVVEVNDALDEAPEAINDDPYGDGWICRLENVDEAGLENLLSVEAYRLFLEEEAS